MPRLLPATLTLAALLLTGCDRIQQSRAERHFQQGVKMLWGGRPEDAIASCDKAIALNPNEPKYYYLRAQALMDCEQYHAALADLGVCLRHDSTHIDYLLLRGIARTEIHDLDAALADFDKVIASKRTSYPLAKRAKALHLRGDFARAIADFDEALRLSPKDTWLFELRADAKISNDDLEGAIEDIDRALAEDPDSVTPQRARALVHMLRGDWHSGQRQLEAPTHNGNPYVHLHLWICRARLDQSGTANEELAQWRDTRVFHGENSWPRHISSFLLGEVPESDFMAHAHTDPNQRGEALYYAALKRHLSGDEPAAIDLYRQCVVTKNFSLYEFRLAREELKRLAPKAQLNR